MAQILETAREPLLAAQLIHDVHLVSLAEHHLVVRLAPKVSADFTQRLGNVLRKETGAPWRIETSPEMGEPSLGEVREALKEKRHEDAKSLPLVAETLKLFPEALIQNVIEMES